MMFVLFGLVILNFGYFSFLWFANMVLFFEYNDCQECTMPPPEEAAAGLANSLVSATPAGQALKMASTTVPGVPTGLPTGVPTGLPTGVPTGLPNDVPKLPTDVPKLPTGVPKLPTDVPKLPGGLSKLTGGLSKLTGGDTKDTTPDTDEVMCEVPNTASEIAIPVLLITFKVILLVVLFFMGLFTGITWFLQTFIIGYIFLNIVSFVSKIEVDNGNGWKDSSFKVVMWRLFRFYKVIITFVIVYMMIKVAWKDLSGPAAHGAIAAAGLIFFFSVCTLFIPRDIPSMTPIIEKPVKIKITLTDAIQSSEQKGGGNRKGCSTIYRTKDVNQLIKNIKKVTKQLYVI